MCIGGLLFMKKFLMAVAGASILVLGACGGGSDTDTKEEDTPVEEPANEDNQTEAPADDEATDEGTDEGADEEEPTADGGTYDAAAAEALYKQSCAGCHGDSFDQQPNIKPLNEYDAATIADAAVNGSENGKMPPVLAGKEDEAENLAAWLSEQ